MAAIFFFTKVPLKLGTENCSTNEEAKELLICQMPILIVITNNITLKRKQLFNTIRITIKLFKGKHGFLVLPFIEEYLNK